MMVISGQFVEGSVKVVVGKKGFDVISCKLEMSNQKKDASISTHCKTCLRSLIDFLIDWGRALQKTFKGKV